MQSEKRIVVIIIGIIIMISYDLLYHSTEVERFFGTQVAQNVQD
jgi:hypothetical protein